MRRAAAILLLMACAVLQSSAQVLRFRFAAGDKYRIVSEVQESVFVNGQFNNSADILNRAALEVVEEGGDRWRFTGTFQVSESLEGAGGLFKAREETFASEFWRDARGRMTVAPRYFAPFQRGVPVFPEAPVAPGQSWRDRGEEVHDLREPFGVAAPVIAPLDVFTTFLGTEERDGARVAVFQINTSTQLKLGSLKSPVGIAPARIMGQSEQVYVFDLERGRLHSTEDRFTYIYLLSNGETIEYEGVSRARVTFAQEMDRDRVKEEIERSIRDQGIPDASVRADDEGVTITLENIQFPPDSDFLMPAEKGKLEKIGRILGRYPDRDLLITGHTALAGTAEGRQRLSEDRAAAVGEYLLSLGVRERTQLRFRGLGAHDPLADNATEEGRRRNRRVEIKILEN